MKATILHPDRNLISVQEYRKMMIESSVAAIQKIFDSRQMVTKGELENTKSHIKTEEDFAEWCFEFTNMDDDYREKTRGMSVGDVVLITDGSAWACMPCGWKKLN